MKTFEVTLSTGRQLVEACYFADSQGDIQRDGTGRWVDFIGEADGPRSTGPVLARFNADQVVSIVRVETHTAPPAPAALAV